MIGVAKRTIIFYKNYLRDFLNEQPAGVKRKVAQVLVWIQQLDRLPLSIFKSIEGVAGLYEIRVEFASNIYRIFCCFDKGCLIILFNAFQKKSQKPQRSEIEKAVSIMKEYFESKED